MFEISQGIQNTAQRVVIYGVAGIGKTTFASKFPNPLFIDTEGGTQRYNLRRLPRPTSRTMLYDEIRYVRDNPHLCDTLVIDTLDWAETLLIEHVCSSRGVSGIEDFGWGNGYTYLSEEIKSFLKLLDEVIDRNIHVVLIAHAQLRKVSVPGEMGEYDQWDLKLGKKTSNQVAPPVKEWASMLLFFNYKTFVVAKDDKGKKFTATDGKRRMMYCSHSAGWDAKNRHGLPDEAEMDYRVIMPHILDKKDLGVGGMDVLANNTVQAATQMYAPAPMQTPDPQPMPTPAPQPNLLDMAEDAPTASAIPKALADLMQADGITEQQVCDAVAKGGFFPAGTPIANYGEQFIKGMLIARWPTVKAIITKFGL